MAKVYLNDEILDPTDAKVSVSDSGLLYGSGLFETMRADNGKVFAINDHLERLFASAETLGINNNYDKKYMADAIYRTLKANKLDDARLRLTLTGGSMADGEKPAPTLLITATNLEPYPAEYYQKGATVIITDTRQNITDPLCGHKTTNFLARLIVLQAARKKSAAEALWFTTNNHLAEGCISNVFLVKNSIVYTPKASTPVLGGIMRKTVCNIAGNEGIELVEKDLVISDLLEADEIFLTNVIMRILPVVLVEAHVVGDGKPGAVTKRLAKLAEKN
jgi:branched-chain amino acid aminotransferase